MFMDSENSKTSKPHVLTLKLTNKLDLRIGKKVIALSNLSIYYKAHTITIKFILDLKKIFQELI